MVPPKSEVLSNRLTELREELEDLWKGTEEPCIQSFCNSRQIGNQPSLVGELLLCDQRNRWRRFATAKVEIQRFADGKTKSEVDSTIESKRPRVEHYLRQFRQLPNDTVNRLILQEYEIRLQIGEQPLGGEYESRFPEHAAGLQESFQGISDDIHPPGPTDMDQWATMHGQIDHAANESKVTYQGANAATNDLETIVGAASAPEKSGRRAGSALKTGDQFGDYLLLGEIGRGGMGVVFRAIQKSLNREVAVKMILAGSLAGTEHVTRFKSEATAAAKLDHPNIVHVFEVGKVEDQHFYSMAYVPGESLEGKLRDGPLPPRESAEIVAKVAMALDYAHRNGIVHRDIKPANIILDDKSEPRITDFGLAKRLVGGDDITATNAVLGTPSYMSPEQAGGDAANTGPSADVYSLGATLYCLLTGKPPFRADNAWETMRQVRQTEAISPRTLNHAIPKDLDTICLKCIEKEPLKRMSAAELASDLERFLRNEPIKSRPISSLTRGFRWCHRNPILSSLFTLVVVSLLVGTVVSTKFAILAQSRAKTADQTALFLTSLFRGSESLSFTGAVIGTGDVGNAATTAKELLDRGAQRVQTQLKDEPLLAAQLMQTIGEVYQSMGLPKEAASQLQGALDRRKELLGERDPLTTESMHHLAWALHSSGSNDEAIEVFEETVKLRKAIFGLMHPDTASSLMMFGLALANASDYDRAETNFETVIDIWQRLPGDNRQSQSLAWAGIASVQLARGEEKAAIGSIEEVHRLVGEGDKASFVDLVFDYQTAEQMMLEGNEKDATPLFENVLESLEDLVGEDHLMCAWVATSLAECLSAQSRNEEAHAVATRAQTIMRSRLRPTQIKYVYADRLIGTIACRTGDYETAEETARFCLDHAERYLVDKPYQIAQAKGDLAFALIAQQKYSEALPFARQALQSFSQPYRTDNEKDIGIERTRRARVFNAQSVVICLIQAADFEEALAIATETRKLTQEFSVSEDYLHDLDVAYTAALLHLGRSTEAESYVEAICAEPNSSDLSRLLLGMSSILSGNLESGKTILGELQSADFDRFTMGRLLAPRTRNLLDGLHLQFPDPDDRESVRKICESLKSSVTPSPGK